MTCVQDTPKDEIRRYIHKTFGLLQVENDTFTELIITTQYLPLSNEQIINKNTVKPISYCLVNEWQRPLNHLNRQNNVKLQLTDHSRKDLYHQPASNRCPRQTRLLLDHSRNHPISRLSSSHCSSFTLLSNH